MRKNYHLKKLFSYIQENNYMKNQSEVAEALGYNAAYLSQIISGRKDVSQKFINKVKSIVPNISENWLVSGEGEMITDEMSSNDVFMASENQMDFRQMLIDTFRGVNPSVPLMLMNELFDSYSFINNRKITCPVSSSTFAVQITGDNFAPRYPSGSVVYVREAAVDGFIEYGATFIIVTANGTTIRRLFPLNHSQFKCVHINPTIAPTPLPIASISRLYRILATLIPE